MTFRSVGLESWGIYLPSERHTSDYISKETGIPRDILEEKFGLKSKTVPGSEDHTVAMGAKASFQALERAHIDMRAGAYLSVVWVNTILALIISVFVYLILVFFLNLDLMLTIFLLIIPGFSTVLAYLFFITSPASQARARGKKIDLHLPYALNFISAMSSALDLVERGQAPSRGTLSLVFLCGAWLQCWTHPIRLR